ncbi:hypothetical protein NMY22_g19235 [Coprinellus aureogranulatus]|nr:hypothetical protein NMY22_g19235 [Coprinellus aureogranulatus]
MTSLSGLEKLWVAVFPTQNSDQGIQREEGVEGAFEEQLARRHTAAGTLLESDSHTDKLKSGWVRQDIVEKRNELERSRLWIGMRAEGGGAGAGTSDILCKVAARKKTSPDIPITERLSARASPTTLIETWVWTPFSLVCGPDWRAQHAYKQRQRHIDKHDVYAT